MSNIACVNQRYLCEIENLQTKAKCLEEQVRTALYATTLSFDASKFVVFFVPFILSLSFFTVANPEGGGVGGRPYSSV